MKIIKKIALDFNRTHLQTVFAKEGDTSRWIEVVLTCDGEKYEIPEGSTVYLCSGKAMSECKIKTDNIVSVRLTDSFTEAGRHMAEIAVYNDDEKVSTFPFMLDVARSAKNDNSIMKEYAPSVIDQIVEFMNTGGADPAVIDSIIDQKMAGIHSGTDPTLQLKGVPADAQATGNARDNLSKQLADLAERFARLSTVARTGSYGDLANRPKGVLKFSGAAIGAYDGSQDVTINIPAPGGSGGTSDYDALIDKPKLNGYTLEGDVSLSDIGFYEGLGENILAWLDQHPEEVVPDKSITPDKCSFFRTTEDNKNYFDPENGMIVTSPDGTEWVLTVSNSGSVSATKLTAVPVKTYSITVEDDGNGTGKANMSSAASGTTVILSAVPNTGYQLEKWQVVSGGVTITDDSFTMGDSDVVVKAIFAKEADCIITYNLGDGIVSSNTASSVAKGAQYSTRISLDGSGDGINVTATMDGVDITNTNITDASVDGKIAYKLITIYNVTGDIVITAISKQADGKAIITDDGSFIVTDDGKAIVL